MRHRRRKFIRGQRIRKHRGKRLRNYAVTRGGIRL